MLIDNQGLFNWLSKELGMPVEEIHIVPAQFSKTAKGGIKAAFARWWYAQQILIDERFPMPDATLRKWYARGWAIIDRPEYTYTVRNPIFHEIVLGIQKEFPQGNHRTVIAQADHDHWIEEPIGSVFKPEQETVTILPYVTRHIEMRRFALGYGYSRNYSGVAEEVYTVVAGYSGYSDTLYIRFLR